MKRLLCKLWHQKWYKINLRGKWSNHMVCQKCGREFSIDRYSTGAK